MTPDDLAQMSREELIQLILAQFEQLAQLKADYEALRLKLEKGKKPPTNSSNSSQPPFGIIAACHRNEANANMVRRQVTRSMSASLWQPRSIS